MSAGYEKSDVNIKILTIVGVSIILFIIISLALLNEYFLVEKEKVVYEEVLKPKSVSLEELHAHETEVLTSYAYDSTTQTYSIPLDSAIEKYLEEQSNSK